VAVEQKLTSDQTKSWTKKLAIGPEDQKVTSMLVMDVEDEMCWWNFQNVSDRLSNFHNQHSISFNISADSQCATNVTKIEIPSPISKIVNNFKSSTSVVEQRCPVKFKDFERWFRYHKKQFKILHLINYSYWWEIMRYNCDRVWRFNMFIGFKNGIDNP